MWVGFIQLSEGLNRTKRHSKGKLTQPDCFGAGTMVCLLLLWTQTQARTTPLALLPSPQLANYRLWDSSASMIS